jgi:hypothetical protein
VLALHYWQARKWNTVWPRELGVTQSMSHLSRRVLAGCRRPPTFAGSWAPQSVCSVTLCPFGSATCRRPCFYVLIGRRRRSRTGMVCLRWKPTKRQSANSFQPRCLSISSSSQECILWVHQQLGALAPSCNLSRGHITFLPDYTVASRERRSVRYRFKGPS